ncbi:hypothetical protein [Nocardia sp. alder85J]|uniref:hypothetical protein n=1 Tax=Nocardia sp. alder85J TaxID=2862949 RepID=UPI001CD7DBF6|nr:hypothetical protein [Nocardia sp. alder85J]MCX4098025.1 hypothetical protein [Nocardia sp. alder85J]
MTDTPQDGETRSKVDEPDNGHVSLSAIARSFIAAAFEALRGEYVIPRPAYDPFAAVGNNYFGDDIRPLAEYGALEAALDNAYPNRFEEPLKRQHAEFSSTYIFSFLEACIARCAQDGKFDASSGSVSKTIEELVSFLDSPDYQGLGVVGFQQASSNSTGLL